MNRNVQLFLVVIVLVGLIFIAGSMLFRVDPAAQQALNATLTAIYAGV